MASLHPTLSDPAFALTEPELLGSLLARLAWRTAHTPASLAHAMGIGWEVWVRDLDRSLSKPLVTKVAAGLGIDEGQVVAMTISSFLAACGVPVKPTGFQPWLTHIGVYHRTRVRFGQMFCSKCLDAPTRHLRLHWRLASSWLCPVHGLPLLDACPHCGKPFMPYRNDELVLARCGHCMESLTTNRPPLEAFYDVELQLCIEKIWSAAAAGQSGPLSGLYEHLVHVSTTDARFARAGEHWSYWRVWERAALLRSQRSTILRYALGNDPRDSMVCPYGRADEERAKPALKRSKQPVDPEQRARLLLCFARRVCWPRRLPARVSR